MMTTHRLITSKRGKTLRLLFEKGQQININFGVKAISVTGEGVSRLFLGRVLRASAIPNGMELDAWISQVIAKAEEAKSPTSFLAGLHTFNPAARERVAATIEKAASYRPRLRHGRGPEGESPAEARRRRARARKEAMKRTQGAT